MWIVTLAAAVLPGLLLIRYFYRRDQNPEPRRVVIFTALLGVLAVIPIVIVELLVSDYLDGLSLQPLLQTFGQAFLVAACVEESFKFLVLKLYSTRHAAYDEPMDGIVYGVAASLGFACLENVLYVLEGGLPVACMRALTAVPGHAACGAIMGYYLGKSSFEPNDSGRNLLFALLIPIFFHGLYDWPLMMVSSEAISWAQSGTGVLVLVVFFFVAFGFEIRYALRCVRDMQQQQERESTDLSSP